MCQHFGAAAIAFAIARLVAYAINDRDRCRRFVMLILLGLAAAVGWWLFGDGGLQFLLHDFGPAGITHPAAVSRHAGLDGLLSASPPALR